MKLVGHDGKRHVIGAEYPRENGLYLLRFCIRKSKTNLGGITNAFVLWEEGFFYKGGFCLERELPEIAMREVLHYLGCHKVDALVEKQILKMIEKVQQLAKPKLVYQIGKLDGVTNELGIPLSGADIKALLESSQEVVFMAATLGAQIDVESKRLSIKDMGDMVVFDAVCNAAIEAVVDAWNEELKEHYLAQGRYLTDRFSCGYGDFSIHVQKDFCAALDTKRKIGVYVSASSLLLPMKSVTALLGVSNQKQQKKITGCAHCDLKETCELRKRGNRCGS